MSYALVIGAVGTVAGAAISSSAAGDAAGAITQGASQNGVASATQANSARAANYPFVKTGTQANAKLSTLLGLGDSGSIKLPNGMSAYDQARNEEDAYLHQYGPAAGAYTSLDQYLGAQPTAAEKDIQDRVKGILAQNGIDPLSYQNDPEYGQLLKKFSASDLAADPVYNSGLQFGLDQGTNAINNRALASGGYDSGATLKALTRFANDYGSTKANDSYNRYTNDQNNTYNKLSGQQAVGLNATQASNAAGQVATGQQIDANSAAANARAAGIVGGNNAWGSVGSSLGTMYGNSQTSALLKSLVQGQTSGVGSNLNNPNYLGGGIYADQ